MIANRFSGTGEFARSAALAMPSCADRAATSLVTDATNSGTPSVRSCNARTKLSSLAIDGERSATYAATSASENESSTISSHRPCR